MIEIGTRPYYGKHFKVCPDVVCNDGNLDVYFPDLWNGRHHWINQRLAKKDRPIIERYEVSKLSVEVCEGESFHIDGELYESSVHQSLCITILPRALNIIVPRSFYRKFHPFEEL